MGRTRAFRVLVALAVIAIAAGVILLKDRGSTRPATPDPQDATYQGTRLGPSAGGSAKAGELAPDFTLLDTTGKPISLSSLRGRVVLINFWASWCRPCRREMPEIEDAFTQNQGRGFIVLGVNQQETRDQAASFAAEYGVTFPVLLDRAGQVSKAYRLTGLPESFIVDAEGIMREHKIGPFTQAQLTESLTAWLDKLSLTPKRELTQAAVVNPSDSRWQP